MRSASDSDTCFSPPLPPKNGVGGRNEVENEEGKKFVNLSTDGKLANDGEGRMSVEGLENEEGYPPALLSPEPNMQQLYLLDKPLSTKREKFLDKTPRRPMPPTPRRQTWTNPRLGKRSPGYINPFAQIVSFKPAGMRPHLSVSYQALKEATYLEQVFTNQTKVGRGYFGEVLRVVCKDDGRSYAVKRSHHVYSSKSERQRMLQEVQKHELLPPHPNLVQFFLAWEEDGHLFIQTELCAQSLNDLANQKRELPAPQCWSYLIDMLLALKHLHSYDLIHLDVKPENILVVYGEDSGMDGVVGTCKLGDFGLIYDEKKESRFSGDFSEGDNRYLAAEVLNAKAPTKAADIFSLGITFLELASDMDLPKNGSNWTLLRKGGPLPENIIANLKPNYLTLVHEQMMHPISTRRPTAAAILDRADVQSFFSQSQWDVFEKSKEAPKELLGPRFCCSPTMSPLPVGPNGRTLDFTNDQSMEEDSEERKRFSFPLTKRLRLASHNGAPKKAGKKGGTKKVENSGGEEEGERPSVIDFLFARPLFSPEPAGQNDESPKSCRQQTRAGDAAAKNCE